MEFAFWSLAYLAPLVLYVWYLLAARESLLDPLALGGLYLFVMFCLADPLDHIGSTANLYLLHATGSVAYWLGGLAGYRVAGSRQGRSALGQRIEARSMVWMLCLVGGLAVAIFVFSVSYDSSLDILFRMRNRTDLRLGAIDTGVGLVQRIALYLRAYLAPLVMFGLLFWCRRSKPTLSSSLLLAVTLGAWLMVSLGGGSRGTVFFMLIACAFAVSYANAGTGQWSLGPRLLVALLLPLGAGIIITQTLYRYTGLPEENLATELRPRAGEAVAKLLEHVSFNDDVAFVITNYPDVYEYSDGQSLCAPLAFMVPRIWWPSKPVPWGRALAWQHGFGYGTTVSMAATVPGEGYANFGPAGWVLFLMAFGFVIGWTLCRLRNPRDEFDLVVGMWGLFWSLCLRGDIYTAIVSIVMPSLLVIIAIRVIGFRRVAAPESSEMLRMVLSYLGTGQETTVSEARRA